MLKNALCCAAIALAGAVCAETDDNIGQLNPEEMSWRSLVDRAERGETGMVLCSSGYMMTKSGDHESARKLFEACAQQGWTGTMTWMSYMDNNGFGGEYDPDASAAWDRRAAELGDPIGQLNHGVNLLRGHGIARDEQLGRQMVDRAAQAGIEAAQRLKRADYDLDEITPDADNWRYAPLF
ncbi:MAG: sel1 repeat family protein [Pelagimonas sp.]|jgi:TPR repeat protein|nr:sel1 repeat family protein [Pelagimonas sp.]